MVNLGVRIFSVAATAIVSALFLLSGCTAAMSRNWVQSTIEKHYYVHSGDYSAIDNLSGLSIEEMVGKLDIYSAYYTAEQYKAVKSDNDGNKSGIGISYSFTEGEGAFISRVVGNSPAKEKGIKEGDVIVGGKSGGKEYVFDTKDAFVSFLEGRATGEIFTLVLKDGREIEIAKADYTASYAAMYTRDKTFDIVYEGTSNKPGISEKSGGFDFLPADAAYMTLSQFYGNAGDEIGVLIGEFNARHCTTLILDLRSNGGGYVDTMSQIAGRFTSAYGGEHISMIARYKDGKEAVEKCYVYKENIVPKGTRVCVMADSGTASASEALIGALVVHDILDYGDIYLSDYGGEVRTYGKGIMQSTYKYVTGEALKLTVAGIFWPDGETSIHGVGVTRGVAVPAEGGAVPGDEELRFIAERL